MLMRLVELADSAKQETQIILDARLVAPMSSLLEVVASSRIFNQRAVYIIVSPFYFRKEH